MALLSATVGVLFCIMSLLSKRHTKGRVYIAYDFSEVDFVLDLKDKLVSQGYRCYPDVSVLVSGSKIKDLNLESQIEKADIAVILVSKESNESSYISYVAKAFKRNGKPIQIYAFADAESIPQYLNPYIIFPLPEDKQGALAMIVRLVNGLFLGKHIRNTKQR